MKSKKRVKDDTVDQKHELKAFFLLLLWLILMLSMMYMFV